MRSLRYLNSILTVLAVLLALTLWTTWTGSPPFAPAARADSGIPDAGAQRREIIDQLKKVNLGLDNFAAMLKSGQAHVRVDNAPDDSKPK